MTLKKLLYQTMVETYDHRLIPVGPKFSERESADNFNAALAANLLINQDKEWRNPHVIIAKE